MNSPTTQGRTHQQIVFGHHLILHGYGHWLPDDPRGSGSERLLSKKLAKLGALHRGRRRVQPGRDELRRFYHTAAPLLEVTPVWSFVTPYEGWPNPRTDAGD